MKEVCSAFAALLPAHKASLTITHNDHLDVYETVAEMVETGIWANRSDFVSSEECDKAIAKNEIWSLQWYPETPVGFHKIFASSLEGLLDGAAV